MVTEEIEFNSRDPGVVLDRERKIDQYTGERTEGADGQQNGRKESSSVSPIQKIKW